MRFSSLRLFFLLMIAILLAVPVLAQDSSNNEKDAGTSIKDLKSLEDAPEQKELTPEEKKERIRSFKKEVGKTYQTWLDQDVRYIISPEEEQAFKLLSTDEERDAVHRAVLAPPRPHSRHRGKRVPRRTLSPHPVR